MLRGSRNRLRGNHNRGQSATASWPPHHRRQRGQDRIDVSAGAQTKDRAAVVEQIELDVAAAPDELLLALGLAPRRCEIAPHQLGIDLQERAADVLSKSELRPPVAGVDIV